MTIIGLLASQRDKKECSNKKRTKYGKFLARSRDKEIVKIITVVNVENKDFEKAKVKFDKKRKSRMGITFVTQLRPINRLLS